VQGGAREVLRDREIVFAAGFLRAVANGLIGVVAGINLADLGLNPAAGMKILYDVLLYLSFRKLKAPEEREDAVRNSVRP
jgi:hypothetical protein